MAIIAIAGGTGGVGKTVVEHLQRYGDHHKVFVIGRKAPTKSLPGSPTFLKANYADLNSLTALLQDHAIDTVVSTINLETEAGGQSQLNLIRVCGFFSDYWGAPHIKSNLKTFQWFIDMEKGVAVVPGSGDEKFTVTYSEDLARFIVRLIDSDEKWPERGFLSGSDISINELIAIAEKIRGSKFEIVHDSVEKLQNGDATVLCHPEEVTEDQFKPMLAGLCQMILAGACVLPNDERRLDKMFPEIPLTSVEEILVLGR
ncbi:hypothetical protein NCS52_01398500 [Fusarium sp. LHS14.1]|nr:hypothetical protein NCS52_01398500 [Fusarium sp. LHS14.1]